MGTTKHEHTWHVISWYVIDPGHGQPLETGDPALWACSGRTSRGDRCIATTSKDPSGASRQTQAIREYEREQRHTNL